MSKDYNLLRPVDLGLVEKGHPTITRSGNQAKYLGKQINNCLAWSIEGSEFLTTSFRNGLAYSHGKSAQDVCMKPLTWVEDKPVYKGDHLYYTGTVGKPASEDVLDHIVACVAERGSVYAITGKGCSPEELTWTKPEHIRKELCVLNGEPVFEGDRLYDTFSQKGDQVGFTTTRAEVMSGYSPENRLRIWGKDMLHRALSRCSRAPTPPKKFVRLMAHIGGKWIEGGWKTAAERESLEFRARESNAYYGDGTHWVEEEGSEQAKPLTVFLNLYPDGVACASTTRAYAESGKARKRVGAAIEFTFPRT